jgi:hypothetical protein
MKALKALGKLGGVSRMISTGIKFLAFINIFNI